MENKKDVIYPSVGMSFKNPGDLKPIEYSLMVNGDIESVNGDYMKLSNKASNLLCSRLLGYKVVGVSLVPALNLEFLFLVNPDTKESEIGFIYTQFKNDKNDVIVGCKDCQNEILTTTPLEQIEQQELCTYYTFVKADCLNFNIDYPVKSWIKVDDCNIRIYFTDGFNPPRYIDYTNFQKIDISNCPLIETNELDCDKIKIFPTTCYPEIQVTDVVTGGENQAGTYQFAICYADVRGNKVTDYFYVTNPLPLFSEPITIALDYPISKSIKLQLSNLNTDFKYVNLVVLKTNNLTTSVYLVETLPVTGNNFEYLFTGLNLGIRLSIDDVLGKKPIYTKAKDLSASNGYLFLDQLEEDKVLNLQKESINLPLYYQTVELNEGDYKNPIIASNYAGYLGDEMYPFGISYTKSNGQQTAIFTIAGREINQNDQIKIDPNVNNDVFPIDDCYPNLKNQKWEVYNTAIKLGNSANNPSINTIITEISCTGKSYQVVRNPSGSISYFTNTDPAIPITIPIEEYACDNCQQEITNQYTGVEGITLVSISNITDPNDYNVISQAGVQTIPVYPNDGDVNIPATPDYPYTKSYRVCDDHTVDDIPSYLDGKQNMTCTGSVAIPQMYNAQCMADVQFNYCSFLRNRGNPTNTACRGDDRNQSWFTFTATKNTAAIMILTNNAPYIQVFDGSQGCGILQPINKNGYVDNCPNTTFGAKYVRYDGLTVGNTYYVKVWTATGDTNPLSGDPKQCYFKICILTPTPISYNTKYVNEIDNLNCKFRVEYTTIYNNKNSCFPQNYEYGLMSYWQSTELYPCNTELFGELAGKPIRHHKFPDNVVSPFAKKNSSTVNGFNRTVDKIYPKGVAINVKDIKTVLLQAELSGKITEEERLSICGYRIYRGNRRGNESIIGKGLLYDIWSYKDNIYNTPNDFLFPNFPFNDNTPNLYLSKKPIKTQFDTFQDNVLKHPFPGTNFSDPGVKNNKYVLNSPNLLFNNPGLGVELKLECEQYGYSQGGYTNVKNNSRYQYIGPGIISAALGFACVEAAFESLTTMAQATLTLPITVLGSGTAIPLGYILAAIGENIASPVRMFSFYGQYYDLISKFAPYVNYASFYSAVGIYDSYLNVENTGNKRRKVVNTSYLKPGILNIKSDTNGSGQYAPGYIKFNNFQRESSTFIEIDKFFPSTTNVDRSRFVPDSSEDWKNTNPKPISSYYASFKNILENQYGNLNSIDWIDTGYNGKIDWTNPTQDTSGDTIFGGDTFITRFANKRKTPFFLEDRVSLSDAITPVPDNSDIALSELPNIAYPRYFMNYPNGLDYSVGSAAIFGQVAVFNGVRADYHFSNFSSTGNSWADGGQLAAALGGTASAAFGIVSLPIAVAAISTSVKNDLGNAVYLQGKYFHSCYGINSFLVESNYNLDYRYGENNLEKDFYPHIGDPTNWMQQSVVPIYYDNFYFYNKDYSKQNHENGWYILNDDYNSVKEDCKAQHPNRVIYSLQDNDNNDRFDGNLIFLANNYFDFDKSAGKLKLVKGIDNNKVIVLQENQSSIFNSYISTPTSEIAQSTIGSNQLFNKSIPSQFVKTDIGWGGSQTSAFISTEFGHYWVDNKRGQILKYSDGIKDVVSPEDSWWFKEYLPFKILEDFPDVNIDNNYKYFGMCITYDSRFKRILFTKRDVKLKREYKHRMTFDGNNFLFEGEVILPTNSKYFINASWTIGYSPLEEKFVSFYSFTPNYYIPNQNYFQSGINYSTTEDVSENGLWTHNLTNQSYQVFYGKLHPFIIEFAQQTDSQTKILNNVSYICEASRFQDEISSGVVQGITYNKALIWNSTQTTGILELIPKEKNNLFQSINYPKNTQNSRQILVEQLETTWYFNSFYDISVKSGLPLLIFNENPYKTLNSNAISYGTQYLTELMRSDYHVIRLENDKYSNYHFVNRFNFIDTNNSIS